MVNLTKLPGETSKQRAQRVAAERAAEAESLKTAKFETPTAKQPKTTAIVETPELADLRRRTGAIREVGTPISTTTPIAAKTKTLGRDFTNRKPTPDDFGGIDAVKSDPESAAALRNALNEFKDTGGFTVFGNDNAIGERIKRTSNGGYITPDGRVVTPNLTAKEPTKLEGTGTINDAALKRISELKGELGTIRGKRDKTITGLAGTGLFGTEGQSIEAPSRSEINIDELTGEIKGIVDKQREDERTRLETAIRLNKEKGDIQLQKAEERARRAKDAAISRYFGRAGGREGVMFEGNLGIIDGIERSSAAEIMTLKNDLESNNLQAEQLLADFDAKTQDQITQMVNQKIKEHNDQYEAQRQQYIDNINLSLKFSAEERAQSAEQRAIQKAKEASAVTVTNDIAKRLGIANDQIGFFVKNYGSVPDGLVGDLNKSLGLNFPTDFFSLPTVTQKKAAINQMKDLIKFQTDKDINPQTFEILKDLYDAELVDKVQAARSVAREGVADSAGKTTAGLGRKITAVENRALGAIGATATNVSDLNAEQMQYLEAFNLLNSSDQDVVDWAEKTMAQAQRNRLGISNKVNEVNKVNEDLFLRGGEPRLTPEGEFVGDANEINSILNQL